MYQDETKWNEMSGTIVFTIKDRQDSDQSIDRSVILSSEWVIKWCGCGWASEWVTKWVGEWVDVIDSSNWLIQWLRVLEVE